MVSKLFRAWMVSVLILLSCNVHAEGAPSMSSYPSRTYCFGRLLLDVPAGAKVALDAKFKGTEKQGSKDFTSFAALKDAQESRAREMAAKEMIRDEGRDEIFRVGGFDPDRLYGKHQLLALDVDSADQVIVIAYHVNLEDISFILEAHKFIGNKDHVFISKGLGADDLHELQADVVQAAKQFTAIDNRALPSQPGFCVDGGMFVDAGRPPVNERFTLVITLPDHPDVLFSIEANAIEEVDKEEPSLKHRVNDELRMMRANYAGAIHVLERGELEAAGQKGYQVAISAPYDVVPGTQIRKFFWSADGVPNDVTRPFMEVDLTIQPTDDGRSTIHSDAEAKALWEQLIGSLRIRPGAVQR